MRVDARRAGRFDDLRRGRGRADVEQGVILAHRWGRRWPLGGDGRLNEERMICAEVGDEVVEVLVTEKAAVGVVAAHVEQLGGVGERRAAQVAPAERVRVADVLVQRFDALVVAAPGDPVVEAAVLALEVTAAPVLVELVRHLEYELAHSA